MSLDVKDVVYKVVYFTCLAASIFMVSEHLRKYLENKDTSSVEFKKFQNEKTNVYPSLTVCFSVDAVHMFRDFTRKHGNITSQDLSSALKGKPELISDLEKAVKILTKITRLKNGNKIFSTAMNGLIVGYDEDYFLHQGSEVIRNKTGVEGFRLLTNSSIFFLSYQDPETRCFTRNLTYEPGLVIQKEYMLLDLPTLKQLGLSLMCIYVHHHHQLMRTMEAPSLVIRTPTKYNIEDEFKQIRINNIRVFRQRPNSKERCDENLLNDDGEWMRAVSQSVGCIPVYWKYMVSENYRLDNLMDQKAPVCKTFSAYRQIYSNFILHKWNTTAYIPPCNKMKVSSDVQISAHNDPSVSKELQSRNLNLLQFLYLTNEYEEIMNVKSVDLEDLFSQIGGSVGILLGYSILQIPTLISMINRLICGVYGHLVGEKKDVVVNNKVEQIANPPGKYVFDNDDKGVMLVSQRNAEVNVYRYNIFNI